ncbi:hypothetical protein JFU47_04000 [Pseudomonas sp. TH39(2020)]|uniref:hypothetical protein n=1 Tax=Pseudomonas sp. TH39(2020) TaxID=2796349 RepID=UPI001913992C|nr:hypothetical protein [Pseudomonas sp. TH39(2020)]MBK5395903.1 hypothetical protein [Pseudomonas sp. TH39(2020)]
MNSWPSTSGFLRSLGSWIVGYLIGLTGNPGAAYIFMTAGMLAAAIIMGWSWYGAKLSC